MYRSTLHWSHWERRWDYYHFGVVLWDIQLSSEQTTSGQITNMYANEAQFTVLSNSWERILSELVESLLKARVTVLCTKYDHNQFSQTSPPHLSNHRQPTYTSETIVFTSIIRSYETNHYFRKEKHKFHLHKSFLSTTSMVQKFK